MLCLEIKEKVLQQMAATPFFDQRLSSATALPLPAATSVTATSAAVLSVIAIFTVVDGITGGGSKANFILVSVDRAGFTPGQTAVSAAAGKAGLFYLPVFIGVADQQRFSGDAIIDIHSVHSKINCLREVLLP